MNFENAVTLAKEKMLHAMTGPGSWSAIHKKHGHHNPAIPAARAIDPYLSAEDKEKALDRAWKELQQEGRLVRSGEIRHKHNNKVVSEFFSSE